MNKLSSSMIGTTEVNSGNYKTLNGFPKLGVKKETSAYSEYRKNGGDAAQYPTALKYESQEIETRILCNGWTEYNALVTAVSDTNFSFKYTYAGQSEVTFSIIGAEIEYESDKRNMAGKIFAHITMAVDV